MKRIENTSGNEVRITFLGDLMCQMQQIWAVEKSGCGYNVVFDKVKELWAESDLVVANLETPVEGRSRLAFEEVRFNAPSSFLDAVAKANIGCLTCANNHILDRGKNGIDATLDEVRKRGILSLGAYKSEEESKKLSVVELKGLRFALIACTYDMNPGRKANMLKENELWKVDLLRYPEAWPGNWVYAIRRTLTGLIPYRIKTWIKMRRNGGRLPSAQPQSDCARADSFNSPEHKPFFENVLNKIREAKKQADVVIVFPHIGGQYNSTPGPWQILATDAFIKEGADLVITNHAHTPLKVERRNETLVAHALGNFCFTPGVGFYNDSCQADYSIALNCVFDAKSKKMVRKSFVVLKTVTRKDGVSVVVLPEAKDANDVEAVIHRVSGHKKAFGAGQEIEL